MPTPTEVVLQLVHGVGVKRFDDLPALYAEDTVVTHPFDPRRPPALRGRAALAEHFAAAGRGGAAGMDFRAEDVVVHRTEDPEVVVVEFAYVGTARYGAVPLRVPNVYVVRVRDGLIVESRDYADHLAFARARGDDEAVASGRPT